MKRFLLLIGIVFVLAACGDEEVQTSEPEQTEPEQTETEQAVEEEPEPEEEQPQTTDNPMEFADKTNDLNVYDQNLYNYEIIGRYTHDKENEQGINEIPFENFLFRFGVLAVEEIESGDQYIVFAGEAENNTEHELYFAPRIEVVTSEQEQSENMNEGAGDIKSGVIENVFSMIPIERGVPESFEVGFYPPYISTDDYTDVEEIGLAVPSEFHLE